jgi:hypothetical protein
MAAEFPWVIWAVGWLAFLKAFIWLAYEPAAPENILQLMAYKYLLNIIPLVVFGIGVWNRRKWAVWGIVIVAVGNLIFFLVNQQTLSLVTSVQSEVRLYRMSLSGIILLCNGPIGDLLILCALPGMLKHTKQ